MLKRRIKEACQKKNVSVSKMLMAANIQSGDYYQAVNGKKSFFPGWRARIAQALDISEADLFPEYQRISK